MVELKRSRFADEKGRLHAPGIERPDDLVPLTVKLPSASDMLELTDDELIELLQRYGIVDPWEQISGDAAALVARSKNLQNPDIFAEENRSLMERMTKRATLSLARRTQERYNTLVILDGRPNVELIRIPDDYDPDRLCERCEALAGTIGTYAQHTEVGLPGSASCLGGDYCRCSLVAVT